MLDIAVCATVEEPLRSNPPTDPATGTCYLIGPAATGAWTGKEGCVAAYTSDGWRYVGPVEGLSVLIRSNNLTATYRLGAWETGALYAAKLTIGGKQVVGPRRPATANPSGGTTIDSQSRTAIGAILDSLRAHGLIES